MNLRVASQVPFHPALVAKKKEKGSSDFITTTCTGDRFHPRISHGDLLQLQQYDSTFFMPEDIFLVVGPRAVYKILCHIYKGENPGELILKCPNSEQYADKVVTLDKLESIFRVKRVVKELCY